MAHHLCEPFFGNYFHVVIQQRENFPLGVLDSKVIQRRVVEGLIVADDLDPFVTLDLIKIGVCFRFYGLIIDNQRLPIIVVCFVLDAFDAFFE